nr:hypothetical protein BaRGS_016297 [Batillaria attramentaria]
MLSGLVWLDTHALLCILDENQRREPGERRQVLREVASFLQSGLKRTTVALTLATLGRKLLAAVSCFLIFVLSEALFKPRLGPGGSEDVDYNASSPASVPLPTDPFICQLSIRQYSRVQRYTMECIIPINQVYSKGFTFLFYAFLLLTFLCLFDFFLWLGRVMIPALRDLDVKRYLDAKSASEGSVRASSKPVLAPFAEFLGWDGRLLLALAGDYCGPLSAAELTVHLWQVFKASQSARPFSAPAAMPVTTAGSGVTSAAGRRGEVTEIPLAVMDERADDTAVSTNDRVPLSPREG